MPLHKPVKMISIADLEAQPTHPLANDLKIINGISPFSERKLYEMGMHTIAQVSEWDEDTTSVMNDELGFAPGRIQREGWVNQARHLVLLEA